MTMPKPSENAKAAFQKLVPPDPAVTTRPMFGNLAGFVNGNMFCGLFGEDLFVRVSVDDHTFHAAVGHRHHCQAAVFRIIEKRIEKRGGGGAERSVCETFEAADAQAIAAERFFDRRSD